MDTPLAIIAYIAISAVVAIVLLFTAPMLLLDRGLAIAWAWISVLSSWILIEALHADFEDEEATRLEFVFSSIAITAQSYGAACRQASAEIDRLITAWKDEKQAILLGETHPRYRIAWRSLLTGHCGSGSTGFTLSAAIDQCESLNHRLGNIMVHYPEEIAE